MNTSNQTERSNRLKAKYKKAGIVRISVWAPERQRDKLIELAAGMRETVFKDFDTALSRMDEKLKAKKIPSGRTERGSP